MSGGTGYPITLAGSVTGTEAHVLLTSPWRKGAPNSNGTAPTPKSRATYLRECKISNAEPAASLNNLIVRVNNAAAVVTLKAGESLQLQKAIVFDISVKSSAAGTLWSVYGVAV